MSRPRPAAASESSACGRGNAVGLTTILDLGQFLDIACCAYVLRARRPSVRLSVTIVDCDYIAQQKWKMAGQAGVLATRILYAEADPNRNIP